MGKIPCQIIINCGLLKAAAGGLAMWASRDPDLRAAAWLLRDQQDEICRFGEALAVLGTDNLSEAQKDDIYTRGGNALALRKTIRTFLAEKAAVPSPKKLTTTRDELYKLIVDFSTTQGDFFSELVEYHEEPST